MGDDEVADELERSRDLLSPDRVGAELVEGEPPTSLEDVGAVAGYGLLEPELGVRGGLYVLPSWSAAESAVAALEKAVPAEAGERVATAQNGRMALVVHAVIDGEDGGRAHDVLSNVLSAFAGDE